MYQLGDFDRAENFGADYTLLDLSQDTKALLCDLNIPDEGWGFLLVKLDSTGTEYLEVWASTQIIPTLRAEMTLVYLYA